MVSISGAGIIVDRKRILLLRRSPDDAYAPGAWACPGGVAQDDETPAEAATREVKEESGLDFLPEQLFMKTEFGDGRRGYRFLGGARGTVKLQESEAVDFGWFTYEEAMELELAFDYRDVIEKLRKEDLL